MKNMFKIIAVAAVLMVAVSNVNAAVSTTKHNLGANGPGPNTYSGTNEVCVFCHTPHGSEASVSVPLWNRSVAAAGAYTTYDSLGTSSLEGSTAPVGSVSIACLSCHDGTQAMDSVLNAPGSGATVASFTAGVWSGNQNPQGIANLTQDLSNDHPVGIQYGGGGLTTASPTGATVDVDFVAASNGNFNNMTVWWVDTAGGTANVREKTDMQLYTRSVAAINSGALQPFVECASCHDPHTDTNSFLRISNDGSAVCLSCHTK